MKIYLDTCSIQRPLDSKTQIRITLEAEAVLGIINLCESDQLELLSSEVLVFEVQRNPHPIRRSFGLEILSKADSFVALDEQIEVRAKVFVEMGIKALDALHLACAESAETDYFCTCDDKFLNKAKRISNLRTKVVSPIELIKVVESW